MMFQVNFQEEFQLIEPLSSPSLVSESVFTSELPPSRIQLYNHNFWLSLNQKLGCPLWIRPLVGPQASPLSPEPGGRLTYLQGSEEDATRDGHTDLVVIVDLPLAVGGKTVYLFENENQNGSCVQVLFNPVSSEGGGEEIFQRIFALMIGPRPDIYAQGNTVVRLGLTATIPHRGRFKHLNA